MEDIKIEMFAEMWKIFFNLILGLNMDFEDSFKHILKVKCFILEPMAYEENQTMKWNWKKKRRISLSNNIHKAVYHDAKAVKEKCFLYKKS
jgi:hypothetical protein